MAVTWFLKNVAVNGFGSLAGTDPGASTSATGWQVAKTASGNFAAMQFGSERTTGFSTTDYLVTTHPAPGSGDSWRTENPYTGSFASANWVFTFAIRAVSAANAQVGRVKFRMWRSTNAAGTSATEITSATQSCGLITGISTTVDSTSTLTFNPGAFSLTNEYLFIQCEWNITTASGSNTGDIDFRCGTPSTIVSSAFAFNELPATHDLALSTAAPARVINQPYFPTVASLALTGLAPLPLGAPPIALTAAPFRSTSPLLDEVPGFDALEEIVLLPASAGLSLSGVAPAIPLRPIPAAATLQLTAQAPAMAGWLIPATVSLSLTGPAPIAVLARQQVPAAAALVLSSAASVLSIGVVQAPAVASLVLAATTPLVSIGTVRIPTSASLALSGAAPILSVGTVQIPAVAALALSGTTPALSIGDVRTPASLSLLLSTTTPAAIQNAIKVPAAVSLVLSANPPLEAWSYVSIAAGLVLSGPTPIVVRTGLAQRHFRFRTDTLAVDSTPTWAAAADVNYNPGLPTFRLRIKVENTGPDAAAVPWQLYASKNGGAYLPVSTTSTMGVKSVDAGASADEAPINTELL